jgi:hypothetical protein
MVKATLPNWQRHEVTRSVMVDGYAKVAHNRTYTTLKLSLCPRATTCFMFSLNDLTAFNQ